MPHQISPNHSIESLTLKKRNRQGIALVDESFSRLLDQDSTSTNSNNNNNNTNNNNNNINTQHNHLYNNSRNVSWEYKNVTLSRVPGYGFGIAVSGGSDNSHFANGDPAIAISDVLKGGPAEGKLNTNDRIISANGIKLENVDYGTAVQVLRDSGPTVNLIIKRRIINQNHKLSLNKITSTGKLKYIQPNDYGINLQVRLFVRESKNGSLIEGDEIVAINGMDVAKLFDFRRAVGVSGIDKITITVVKQQQQQTSTLEPQHQTQPSYESSNGNLYVQPPTRNFHHKKNHSVEELPPPPPPIRPPLPKEIYNSSPPPPPPPPVMSPQQSQPYDLHEPRFINFIKKNQLGIKLSGGNNVGLFISAIQPGTPADLAGLKRGDRILRVNDVDFDKLTREEAIERLALLKNDSIVSFMVRWTGDYEKHLQEQYQDRVYYRILYDFENVKRNSVIFVYDTVSNNHYHWDCIYDGRKVNLPNSKQAKDYLHKKYGPNNPIKEPYVRVHRRQVSWNRPIVVYSNITEIIYERLCKEFPNRFTIINSTIIEELHEELSLNKGMHGLLQIKSVASYERLVNTVAPVAILVKTDDKNLLKKSKIYTNTAYSSLLRSFNKTTQSRKLQDDLLKTEQELGGFISKSISVTAENYFNLVFAAIEQELRVDTIYIAEEQQSNKAIPNYNVPPPYAVNNGHHKQDYMKLKQNSTPVRTPLTVNGSSAPSSRPPTSSSKDYLYYEQIKSDKRKEFIEARALAHTPEPIAPQVDRTKKPFKNSPSSGPKPVPPPKPTKPSLSHKADGMDQGYYLNLPCNSKIFENKFEGGRRDGHRSAFELYKRPQQNSVSQLPLLQENTTSGTFDSKGGTLIQRNVPPSQIPIELRIPSGAIPDGTVQTIWFHAVPVNKDNHLDIINGNVDGSSNLISPLIKFGPEGYRFLKPVEIRIPQYSKQNASVLMSSDSNKTWSKINIQNDLLDNNDATPYKIVSLTIQQF